MVVEDGSDDAAPLRIIRQILLRTRLQGPGARTSRFDGVPPKAPAASWASPSQDHGETVVASASREEESVRRAVNEVRAPCRQ
jgi:hypothetical protein